MPFPPRLPGTGTSRTCRRRRAARILSMRRRTGLPGPGQRSRCHLPARRLRALLARRWAAPPIRFVAIPEALMVVVVVVLAMTMTVLVAVMVVIVIVAVIGFDLLRLRIAVHQSL